MDECIPRKVRTLSHDGQEVQYRQNLGGLAVREQLTRETGRSRMSGLGADLRAISGRCGVQPSGPIGPENSVAL